MNMAAGWITACKKSPQIRQVLGIGIKRDLSLTGWCSVRTLTLDKKVTTDNGWIKKPHLGLCHSLLDKTYLQEIQVFTI